MHKVAAVVASSLLAALVVSCSNGSKPGGDVATTVTVWFASKHDIDHHQPNIVVGGGYWFTDTAIASDRVRKYQSVTTVKPLRPDKAGQSWAGVSVLRKQDESGGKQEVLRVIGVREGRKIKLQWKATKPTRLTVKSEVPVYAKVEGDEVRRELPLTLESGKYDITLWAEEGTGVDFDDSSSN